MISRLLDMAVHKLLLDARRKGDVRPAIPRPAGVRVPQDEGSGISG